MSLCHSRSIRIEAQSGVAFTLLKGQTLRVIDPFGEQVADLFAVNAHNTCSTLSSGRTIDYAGRIYLTTEDVLYSNDSLPMLRISADTVGRHDFLLTPCSQRMFEILYHHRGHHPNCLDNLANAMRDLGVSRTQIGVTFNIFMNVEIDLDGRLTVGKPRSRAGDHIDLVAEMDLLCGLTACSAEGSNNGAFKPVDYMIMT